MQPADLYALLAHEVGHATRRSTTLKNVMVYGAAPILVLLLGGALSLLLLLSNSQSTTTIASVVVLAATLLLTTIALKIVDKKQDDLALQEEYKADAFAVRVTGRGDAVERLLHEHSRIEDAGAPGIWDIPRIERAKSVLSSPPPEALMH